MNNILPFLQNIGSHNQYIEFQNLQIVSPSEKVKKISVLGYHLRKCGSNQFSEKQKIKITYIVLIFFNQCLGDRVVILAESGADWYFGHTLTNEAHKGIFPKEYVFITSNDLDIQEPLVDEINSSLKEWNAIMKNKYVNDEAEVKIIEGKII